MTTHQRWNALASHPFIRQEVYLCLDALRRSAAQPMVPLLACKEAPQAIVRASRPQSPTRIPVKWRPRGVFYLLTASVRSLRSLLPGSILRADGGFSRRDEVKLAQKRWSPHTKGRLILDEDQRPIRVGTTVAEDSETSALAGVWHFRRTCHHFPSSLFAPRRLRSP